MNAFHALIGKITGIHRGTISFDEIRELVDKPAPVIFEIGANDGADTMNFATTFPKGRVVAFEPDPRAAKRWHDKVTAQNAELHELAISYTNGTLTFHQSDGDFEGSPEGGWDLSGSLRAPKRHLDRHPIVEFNSTIEVPTSTLDDFCDAQGIEAIDFIWADVQGAESDLIKGGQKMLAKTRFFYTEYNNRELYEGQWTLSQIAAALPHHRLRKRWKNDALFALKSET
jgi:FkbM family methyltransferase